MLKKIIQEIKEELSLLGYNEHLMFPGLNTVCNQINEDSLIGKRNSFDNKEIPNK
jgi:hypothetical protein